MVLDKERIEKTKMEENRNLEKTYDPSKVEERLYKMWTDNGYFHAERDPEKEPYTIVIPPFTE